MELKKQVNQHANVREYLMMFINNLLIITSDDVKLQASVLAKLTETTNQLTRKASVTHNKLISFSSCSSYL
jgi:hypothetical protein